ncbi:MAG: hypothetical protein M1838_005005 [Thelocarpon superellum]|nr:MAG: hypothetical protein M1838_005005 [Thelocarpon superellum]
MSSTAYEDVEPVGSTMVLPSPPKTFTFALHPEAPGPASDPERRARSVPVSERRAPVRIRQRDSSLTSLHDYRHSGATDDLPSGSESSSADQSSCADQSSSEDQGRPGSDGSVRSDDTDDSVFIRRRRRVTVTTDGGITVEELRESDTSPTREVEVIHPDGYEEAIEDHASDSAEEPSWDPYGPEANHIVRSFQEMCVNVISSPDDQNRRYRRKKKRWSAGIFKRSHSQSIGSDSDTDDDETLDAHDLGSSARRLRRRVRGPGDRTSLIFDDPHPDAVVTEIEEARDDDGDPIEGPTTLPSPEAALDPMDVQ